MRSRTCTMEGPDDGLIQTTKGVNTLEEENTTEQTKRRSKEKKPQTAAESRKPAALNLTKKNLLHLLGIMEGEVQAREDVIVLLKTDRTGPEHLEAQYGSADPTRPLQALQRDAPLARSRTDDVYETPMAELDRLEDKQKETYRRMLEQLLLAEKCHRRTVMELDDEKRKHVDFMNKSDDFTNLLEQERERLKKLLEQEKVYQARKDKDHSRRLERVRAELVKLKSFALMLVDERQLHIEQIDQQTQKIQDLGQKLQEKEQRLVALTEAAKNDNQKVLRLEAELENRAAEFAQRHEDTSSKLTDEQAQSKQLRLRLAGVTHQIEELEESNKVLQRSEEELRELREKISSGECGNSSVVSELENLRKRVLEMEGKDEEITKAETQCRELRKRLQEEENHSTDLRLEVDKLQKKMAELEKLEGAFSRSKSECAQLHTNLGKEKRAVMDLAAELEKVKTHLKELEALESKFENSELILRDDLMKLKSFTVIWVDERKNMTERLRAEEQKSASLSKKLKEEQSKVTDVTEKLIEESKKLLRLKSDMEVKVTNLAKEKDELKTKLASEEEKREELNRNLSGMKLRMDGLEEKEKNQKKLDEKRNLNDNRVKQLSLEIERLKSRLKQLEVVEGDLMKTEDEYDLLEKKYRTEQDKANALSELLEDMKSQIARNKAIEKGEVESPESELRIRCRMEEERSRELQVDVQALKEKIHELMNKEDQLSQLLVDYSVLQQRCRDEEEKNKGMSQELVELTEELEATRRYSRALRPGMPGRRTTSTAAQTDQLVRESAEDHTAAGFIRQSVLEENHLMSNLRQQSLKRPTVLERYPPASAEVGTRRSWLPWMKKDPNTVNRTSPERSPGQPLHIRVTPDHKTSTATLEITSPRAEDFFSSTTIIPTLGLQKPRITIVPKAATLTPKTKAPDTSGVLDQAKTPITITTISRAKSPDSDHRQSPVSIITVTTTPVAEAGAPQETSAGRTVIKMGADKQPAPARAYNSNIITTEDNKIHIHLGPQFKRAAAGSSSPVLSLKTGGISSESKDTGTVLRSPRQPSTGKTPPSKMSSSITITPVCSTASRTTQSVPGSDVQSARSTRIPVAKSLKLSNKLVSGVSSVTGSGSRSENQLMKIELRKSTRGVKS